MFKVANWNATGHWGPTHQWLPAILSSIHLFFPEDISQFSEVTFSGGLRRLTTSSSILFSAIVPATLSISPPIIPWVPHFVSHQKRMRRKSNIYRWEIWDCPKIGLSSGKIGQKILWSRHLCHLTLSIMYQENFHTRRSDKSWKDIFMSQYYLHRGWTDAFK